MKHDYQYKLISRSKYFDKKWYLNRYPDIAKAKIDPVEHYITHGWHEGRNPGPRFSTSAYLTYNPDVKHANMCPLVHWEQFGKKEKRIMGVAPALLENYVGNVREKYKKNALSPEMKQDYMVIKKSKFFNAKWYKSTYGIPNDFDPVEHYLNQGYKDGYNPSELFYNDFYLSVYPDILYADINPLLHYIKFGRAEGRITSSLTHSVNYALQPRHCVLLISHELSLTGAPIALMNFARVLKKNNISFMILSPKPGDLEADLQKYDLPYLIDTGLFAKLYRQDIEAQTFFDKFDTILFNTIDTLRYAQYIDSGATKICWVHEGEFGYSCAENNIDVRDAFDVMDMVYSVGVYSQSFTDKYIESSKSKIFLYGIDEIQAQQTSVVKNNKLTFGIFGTCCQRKGQDLFIKAIKRLPKHIKTRCKFKIVGSVSDNNFCKQLKELARGEHIEFTGQLSHENTLEEMATTDVIVCPSLDDPMPIVCTEAMMLNKPVICSDKTGTAAFIEDGVNSYLLNIDDDNLDKVIIRAFNNKNNLMLMGKKWRNVYDKNFTNSVFEKNVLDIVLYKKWCRADATTTISDINDVSVEKSEFDVIVPLGASCHTSMLLRMMGLQTYSYPLDWSASDNDGNDDMGLSKRTELLCNNFKDFITETDLIERKHDSKKHRFIVNTKTHLHYVHDFPVSRSVSEEFPDFHARYSRRVQRLINDIKAAKTVAFIWSQDTWDQIRTNVTYQSDETWINAYNALVECFPSKHIVFFIFEHDANMPEKLIEKTNIDNKIFRFKSNHSILDLHCCEKRYNQYMIASIGAVLKKIQKQ